MSKVQIVGPEGLDEHGRAAYAALTERLKGVGRDDVLYEIELTRFAKMLGDFWSMNAEISKHGRVTMVASYGKDKSDSEAPKIPRLNPLIKVVSALQTELRLMSDRFGLSPMARAGLLARQFGGEKGSNRLPLGDQSGADNPVSDDPVTFQ